MLGFQVPAQTSLFYYKMGETSGTFADSGPAALALTVNGTIVRGEDSILPGDPSGASASQDKDTHMASRPDNALYDRGGADPNKHKLTVACWVKQTRVKRGNLNHQALICKGSKIYSLAIDSGSALRAGIAGQSDLAVGGTLFAPGAPIFVVSVFDGPGQTWKLYLNGVLKATRTLASGQTVGYTSGGTLYVGGQAALGNDGVSGHLQNVMVLSGNALNAFAIRSLYHVGAANLDVEARGDGMYVYPTTRPVVSDNGSYDWIRFMNGSDTPMWLARGQDAVVGAGEYLPPRGGNFTTSDWTADWSAIHEGYMGAKLLSIRKG